MTHNLTRTRVTEIDLTLDLTPFLTQLGSRNADWAMLPGRDNALRLEHNFVEAGYLVGLRDQMTLRVGALGWTGVGSGLYWQDLLELLRSGNGKVEMTVVWEDGTVAQYTITDGAMVMQTIAQ